LNRRICRRRRLQKAATFPTTLRLVLGREAHNLSAQTHDLIAGLFDRQDLGGVLHVNRRLRLQEDMKAAEAAEGGDAPNYPPGAVPPHSLCITQLVGGYRGATEL
jgi:hypothetical protein